jgi:EmrB/QacA subfamily drug resistance transporter
MTHLEAQPLAPQARFAFSRRAGAATPNQVLAIVCVGICLANLDLFIVNVALPNVSRNFGDANMEDLSWVLNGYAIVYAALLVFFGRLVERYRRDLSFLAGVALFTVASAACAAAQGVWGLVAFRVLQAAGAALMTPTSLGLLLTSFPPEKRGAAVRTWTAIGGFAAALGPLAGGLLLTLSWRWIFLVNVPAGLLAIWLGWRMLPHVPGHDVKPPDPLAALMVTGGVAALVLAIVKLNDWGWRSPSELATLAATLILIGAFARHCLRSTNPFIDPVLFWVRPYAGAVLVMAPYSAAFGAMLLSVSLWEQAEWGWTALQTGLVIMPGPLLVPTTSLLLSGRLISRFGSSAVVAAGILFFAFGLAVWATAVQTTPNAVAILGGMIPAGIGVGLTFPTLMGVAAASLPPSSFSTGSGVINMIRQAALAVGVAVFIAIVGAPETPLQRLYAFREGWWVMVLVVLLGLIPTFVLIRHKRAT